ncbi:MAG: hydroxymethylbilane synthase [Akkermansiaceae bacterium]|nr:hydroxymethylbilane synthase [Verrucomicrobiales bacterium]
MKTTETILIATRGSALALAQSNMILAKCRAAFPDQAFDLKIIKTTGDKLQTASLAKTQEAESLPKGLFTKELEVALLDKSADFAVHSLKDLPTELPTGLKLGAVGGKRENVRDVLLYPDANVVESSKFQVPSSKPEQGRGFNPGLAIKDLPAGAVVATSSTRRKAQLLAQNPGLKTPDIRGNVLTRMQKLMDNPELDATVLALAGISRLGYRITPDGKIQGPDVPPGLLATILEPEVMLPCVGQGAIGIEIREHDTRIAAICEKLNDFHTLQCVIAERAFLSGMGGGCQSPVGAYAEVIGDQIRMRVVSFMGETVRRAEAQGAIQEPAKLGRQLADEIRGN